MIGRAFRRGHVMACNGLVVARSAVLTWSYEDEEGSLDCNFDKVLGKKYKSYAQHTRQAKLNMSLHSMTKPSPAAQAERRACAAKQAQGQHLIWVVIAGIVLLLTVHHLLTALRTRLLRRREGARRARQSWRISLADPAPKQLTYAGVALRAARAAYANTMHVRRYPLLLWSATGAEVLASLAYTGLILGVTFWSGYSGEMRYLRPMGHAAFAQLPLVIGLAARNSVLSAVTGVSTHALKGLHRAAGRVCVLTATIHSAGYLAKGFKPSWMFITGLVAWMPLLLLLVSSFAALRRAAYELFIAFHILMVVATIAGCWLHAPSMYFRAWIIAGLALWLLDRLASLARLAINSLTSPKPEIEVLSPDVVRVTIPSRLTWKAGQHAYLRTATQSHPFTLASPTEATFLIRGHRGFTARLLTSTPRIALDGPYGSPPDLNAYATVLLVTGGTGVSYGLAHLAAIIAAAHKHTSSAAQVRLVWNVRSSSHVRWIAPLLNDALARGSGYVRIAVDVYVTRSHLSNEGSGAETPGASPPDTPGSGHSRAAAPSAEPPAALLRTASHVSSATFGSESIYSQPCPTSLSLPQFTDDLEKGAVSSRSSSPTLAGDLEKASFEYHPAFGPLAGLDVYGLSPAAALVTTLHRGRSDAETLLRADLASPDGGVAVAVCGPPSLDRDVRRAVLEVNGVRDALGGQEPVAFFSETFEM